MLAELSVGEGSTWVADGCHIAVCPCDLLFLHVCALFSSSKGTDSVMSVSFTASHFYYLKNVSCSVVSDSLLPRGLQTQSPLSVEFSRQEFWSVLPLPTPGDLPNPRIKPQSPTSQADSLPSEPQGKPHLKLTISRDFPGGPVVKTLTSRTGSVCLIPGQVAKIPHVLQLKNQNPKTT